MWQEKWLQLLTQYENITHVESSVHMCVLYMSDVFILKHRNNNGTQTFPLSHNIAMIFFSFLKEWLASQLFTILSFITSIN